MHKILVFVISVLFSVSVNAATLINDTQTENLLSQIIRPVAQAANMDIERVKIHIVNDEDFNAFVMGGEDIYIYTGLLKQIKTPDALAAVVAHEIGHTVGGHMAQMSSRMDAEMKRTMIIQALGIGLMFAGGNPSLGAGILAGSSGIAKQSMLSFSRDEERIADNLGLDLLARAKLNPNGFITVFEQMNEMTAALESKINPNHINHPLTSERLNNMRSRIAELPKSARNQKISKSIISEYEMVRAKLIGYLDNPSRVNTLYPESDKSAASSFAHAIMNMRIGKLDIARNTVQSLIKQFPKNPYFYELFGDIEYQLGNYDGAVSAYEQSLKLSGTAPQIETALSLVLIERGETNDISRAAELCRHAILFEPTPLAYWTLARTFDADDGRADWAMAEFYNMNNDKKNTKKYAKSAMKKLSSNTPEYKKSSDLVK